MFGCGRQTRCAPLRASVNAVLKSFFWLRRCRAVELL
jgi:hypothetical protein